MPQIRPKAGAELVLKIARIEAVAVSYPEPEDCDRLRLVENFLGEKALSR